MGEIKFLMSNSDCQQQLPDSVQSDYRAFFESLVALKNSLVKIDAVDHLLQNDNFDVDKLKVTLCYSINSLYRAYLKLEGRDDSGVMKLIDENRSSFKLLKEFNLHEEFKKNIDLSIAKRIIKLGSGADSSYSVNESLISSKKSN